MAAKLAAILSNHPIIELVVLASYAFNFDILGLDYQISSSSRMPGFVEQSVVHMV